MDLKELKLTIILIINAISHGKSSWLDGLDARMKNVNGQDCKSKNIQFFTIMIILLHFVPLIFQFKLIHHNTLSVNEDNIALVKIILCFIKCLNLVLLVSIFYKNINAFLITMLIYIRWIAVRYFFIFTWCTLNMTHSHRGFTQTAFWDCTLWQWVNYTLKCVWRRSNKL